MDLPKRKSNRLKGYNYSQNGVYFLTVCTKDKKCILGRVVGGGDLDAPKMILSDCGEIVEKYIQSIDSSYEQIKVLNYVVMPNHIHLIVMIYSDDKVLDETANKTASNAVIPTMISALKRYINKEIGMNIWQRSYHDHIIRNEISFNSIWEYVDDNPVRWKKDCFYCD